MFSIYHYQVYVETVHINSVPKTATVGPAFFVGNTQPRMYPPSQWVPLWNFPNDTPAITDHADTSPKRVSEYSMFETSGDFQFVSGLLTIIKTSL